MTVLVGILILAAGVVNGFIDIKRRKTCSASAIATVVDVKRRRQNRRNSYQPVFEFRAEGRTIQGDGGVLSADSRKKYQVGDTVEILYNEENPEEFRVPGKIGMLLASVVMIAVGIGIIFMAITNHFQG